LGQNARIIQEKESKLEKLLSIISYIIGDIDLDTVLNNVLKNAEELMEAEASSFLLLNKNKDELHAFVATGNAGEQIKKQDGIKVGTGISGWVAQNVKSLLIKDAYQDTRFCSDYDKKTGFQTKSVVCVPLIVKGNLIGVGQIINKKNAAYFDDQDLNIFTKFCEIAALALDNALMHQKRIEQDRVQRDLELAEDIQRAFLPENLPVVKDLKIDYRYLASRYLAGDFLDISFLPNGNVSLIIADVSGKGISAALFGSRVSHEFSHLRKDLQNLEKIFKKLNNIVCKYSTKGMFVTAIGMELNPNTGDCQIVNAGHPRPIALTPISPKNMDVNELEQKSGPPLGIVEDAEYPINDFVLKENETMIFYTDGVSEAIMNDGSRFESKNIFEVLKKNQFYPLNGLLQKLNQQCSGKDQADDITVVSFCRIKFKQLDIKSDPAELSKVRHLIETIGNELNYTNKEINQINLAVTESIVNIIEHTYMFKKDKDIRVQINRNNFGLHIFIRDWGEKQDPKNFKSRDLKDVKPGGLGVFFISELMDIVNYDNSYTTGNGLHLIKLRE